MEFNEKPILFKVPLVRKIRAKEKLETRRVLDVSFANVRWFDQVERAVYCTPDGRPYPELGMRKCPYGLPGDRLWVREGIYVDLPEYADCRLPRDKPKGIDGHIHYRADDTCPEVAKGRWRSPIHMRRWAARTFLEITEIDVERLQDITVLEIAREGLNWRDDPEAKLCDGPREYFAETWDKINSGRGYSFRHNPFVWVIKFKLLENVDGDHD